MVFCEDSFGSRKPSMLLAGLIRACHHPEKPAYSRMLAPVIRKIISNGFFSLPLDVEVDGLHLRCYFNDNYSEKKYVFTPWRYDLQERRLLSNQLANGGTFVDIGANVGLYTLHAAKTMTGKQGRIIAIEPNPVTLKRLRFNIQANDQLITDQMSIDILTTGVADRDTTFELKIASGNLGQSSISSSNRIRTEQSGNTSVTIHCRPLLDILADLQISRIDAMKIDIEGAEDMALAPYLAQAPLALLARMILIENSNHLWSVDLFSLMESRGYRKALSNSMNSVYTLQET